jgi:hypothetical protein
MVGEQRQQQSRIPPIMLLFACFRFADFRRMTDAAFDLQLFHRGSLLSIDANSFGENGRFVNGSCTAIVELLSICVSLERLPAP